MRNDNDSKVKVDISVSSTILESDDFLNDSCISFKKNDGMCRKGINYLSSRAWRKVVRQLGTYANVSIIP